MSTKTIGAIVAIVGLLVLLVSALADVLGVGSAIGAGTFGPRQMAGTAVGAVVLIVGVVLFMRQPQA
jgi:hypothetical protein